MSFFIPQTAAQLLNAYLMGNWATWVGVGKVTAHLVDTCYLGDRAFAMDLEVCPRSCLLASGLVSNTILYSTELAVSLHFLKPSESPHCSEVEV